MRIYKSIIILNLAIFALSLNVYSQNNVLGNNNQAYLTYIKTELQKKPTTRAKALKCLVRSQYVLAHIRMRSTF